MALIDESFECKNDDECSIGKYCYEVSKRCVGYTICSRYNREEGRIAARNASQCGPCMEGYATEGLGPGGEISLCKKNFITLNENQTFMMDSTIWIWVVVILFAVLVIILGCFFRHVLKEYWFSALNNYFRRRDTVADIANVNASASAPPQEQAPFIKIRKGECSISYNNNERFTDTIEYQTTVPCVPAFWMTDEYYGRLDDNAPNNVPLNPAVDDNDPINGQNPPRQLAVVTPEVDIGHQDNARNTIISQTYSSNNDNNENHDTDSTSGTDRNKYNRPSKVIIQSLNQNITMSVNME